MTQSNLYHSGDREEDSRDKQVETATVDPNETKSIYINFGVADRKYYRKITVSIGTESGDIDYDIVLDQHENINAEFSVASRTLSSGVSEAVTIEHQVREIEIRVSGATSTTDIEIVGIGQR